MHYLTVATALVAVLAIANLLLALGIIRRLREHTAELAELRGGSGFPGGAGDIALAAGAPAGAFTAESVDGRPVTLDTLGDHPLIGFFSPSCSPCKERLPAFIEYAASRPAGPDAILAVVTGTPETAADLVEQLLPVATVVVEPDQGPVQQAFQVTGFPVFMLVEDGVVRASDYELTSISARDAVVLPAAG
ncbi:TlpA disulfide reductase family protein [Nonomuraea jiangxiensis]|uniref:Thiol-disulfide isomerase or thioredoxin n=1 Tax=Nonomuraea jiangxiensis TaxID=633440 RepID=A0A1G8Q618_9ACTN|nr:TlpA disulfide reductase family protein [Nonomuraea jiangxiensis]SDJ00131.1 Thiol-disulfide isomerase or thioredoxin [Nonomuraea jiangxiensis]